jgi:MoaA/NifB/PqqE/SkfB family radical SAM enzyme
MKVSTLASLALKHARGAVAEEIYLKTGYDATKPVTFYGLVNERCNVKCKYCEYWRLPQYKDEMSIEQWQQALTSIKDFVGKFSISFSGGEPFIKPGFLDLLAWCGQNGIHAGVTTNGSALTRKNAKKVVDAKPLNVNVSVDAPGELHDHLRGYKGLFAKLSDGIKYLREEREAAGGDFPIVIKTTVGGKNFTQMPDMVDWAEQIGATAIHFQPMDRWTPETYDELWIEADRHPELQEVVDKVLALKRAGKSIMNSDDTLRLMPAHFREESAPPEVMPCLVGVREFFIRTNGDVEVCFFFPAIGNIKENSAREIWYGEKAQKVRKETVACTKLCLYTCLSQKTLTDKVKMGLKILNNKPLKVAPAPEQPVGA